MLLELSVRNVAVVAGASLELGPGLNALTGETGAGKSIVVDALSLLSGARASTDRIRTGADSLTVTGVFAPTGADWRGVLEEAGIEVDPTGPDGGELLIRREISHTGRNRIFVNDQPATARLLSRLAPYLLRIHGQREELSLMSPELQRRWLDRCGGADGAPLKARVREAHERWVALAARLESLTGDARAREERLDMLRFQAQELDAARIRAGEDEELRSERDVLRNAEAIRAGLETAWGLLADDEEAVAARLARIRAALADIASWDDQAEGWAAEAEELRIRAEELARELLGRLDAVDRDPGRLDVVEDRLALLERLGRKYGGDSRQLLERQAEIQSELDGLSGAAVDREALESEVAESLETYSAAALELSAARRAWGDVLAARIREELGELGLGKARLDVNLERRGRAGAPLEVDGVALDPGPEGIDSVVFTFAANPGEEPRPLAKIASGGELSRVSLALQLATRGDEVQGAPTLVFDEVDTGIGGAEAAALGRKLQRLATGGQILAVTHLPQVAAFADLHAKVSKAQEGERTFTRVERLGADERVDEIARMLAGAEVTDLSRSHAGELLRGSARPDAAAAS